MNPKEKAKELFDKFNYFLPDAVEINKEHLKYCASILVDENLKYMYKIAYINNLDRNWINEQENYFNEVMQEIRNI